MNTENLLKLATYLLSGDLKTGFDMGLFSSIRGYRGLYHTHCGTAGCAIGHGPYAGIPKTTDENWSEYSSRVFGLSITDCERGEDMWDWCFSDMWEDIDNTPEGAGKRILYLLHNSHLHDIPTVSLRNTYLYQNETL